MPGEVIDRPNPQPLASNIPDHVQDLAIKLQNIELSDADRKGLEEFRRASNYIAAGEKLPALLKGWENLFFAVLQSPDPFANAGSYDLPPRQCFTR